jgi:hypothetical protein
LNPPSVSSLVPWLSLPHAESVTEFPTFTAKSNPIQFNSNWWIKKQSHTMLTADAPLLLVALSVSLALLDVLKEKV